MIDFLTALALLFVIEGAIYALFPAAMKRFMVQTMDLPEATLRTFGLVAAAIGVVCVWILRG